MGNVKHLLRRAMSAAWLAAILIPATSFAQQASTPDQPSLRNAPQPWVGYMLIVVMLVVVMVVSL
ncbi:MAG: hypothetical protein SYC29_02640, partial [Planctomycetota bacterium]|nr:hypothetical protein [Planctomycetota bacterium]